MGEMHPFAEAVEKFHGKNIEVKDVLGDCYRGRCIAINKPTLHVILETEDGINIIKNANIIRRDLDEPKGKFIKLDEVKVMQPSLNVEELKKFKETKKRKKKGEEKDAEKEAV